MASSQSTVDFLLKQMEKAGKMSTKKMFGEYGIYCDEKIVAFVCDDQLFIKPTLAGEKFIGNCTEGFPYPGAKPYFLISRQKWDDAKWLTALIQVTAKELPLPKNKPKKK